MRVARPVRRAGRRDPPAEMLAGRSGPTPTPNSTVRAAVSSMTSTRCSTSSAATSLVGWWPRARTRSWHRSSWRTRFSPRRSRGIRSPSTPTVSSMRSNPVSALMLNLGGVTRSHSRPHGERQPILRSRFQAAEVLSEFSRALRLHRGRPGVLRGVLQLLQPRPPALRNRTAHARIPSLRHTRRNSRAATGHLDSRVRGQPDSPSSTTSAGTHDPRNRVDQSADQGGAR